MNSIPADVQRRMAVEDLCHEILDRIGMGSYSEALNFVSCTGEGRIAAMQWQVIFQHLLIRRRNLCHRYQQDFYQVEKKAETAVKKLKVEDPYLNWLLVYLYTAALLIPADTSAWTYAVDTIKSWPASQ